MTNLSVFLFLPGNVPVVWIYISSWIDAAGNFWPFVGRGPELSHFYRNSHNKVTCKVLIKGMFCCIFPLLHMGVLS